MKTMTQSRNEKGAESRDTLDIFHLSYTYRSKWRLFKRGTPMEVKALQDVSFTLTPGFYGLLGPNGAGKSTLINIIVGLLRQEEGVVSWNRKPSRVLGVDFRRVLGYMPQQQTLYDSYTGRRFLSYIASLKEIPPQQTAQEVLRVASLVNLSLELDKRLAAYSGGMKQRILAAAAMMGSPKILILDEPTAGLDPKERVHLRMLLAEMAKESIVLVATHVVSDIESVSDEVLILKDGRLHDKDSPKKLVAKYAAKQNLEAVYLAVFGSEEAG